MCLFLIIESDTSLQASLRQWALSMNWNSGRSVISSSKHDAIQQSVHQMPTVTLVDLDTRGSLSYIDWALKNNRINLLFILANTITESRKNKIRNFKPNGIYKKPIDFIFLETAIISALKNVNHSAFWQWSDKTIKQYEYIAKQQSILLNRYDSRHS